MDIKTKFDMGQRVWFLDEDHKPNYSYIEGIRIRVESHGYNENEKIRGIVLYKLASNAKRKNKDFCLNDRFKYGIEDDSNAIYFQSEIFGSLEEMKEKFCEAIDGFIQR